MIEVKLPRLDDKIDESMVIFWHKQIGDSVSPGDVLLEVQTEKAVTEIEAEQEGILQEILVKRGEAATVGDVLCKLGSTTPEDQQADQTKDKETITEKPKTRSTFVRVAPRLRRLAKELKVDLSVLQNHLAGARITEKTIQEFAESSDPSKDKGEKLTGIRQTIANRMRESLQNTAQLTETAYADVTNLTKKRENYEEKLSWTTWILSFVVKALQEHPYMNGTFEDNLWNQSKNIHLGVAADMKDGLIVPVVKNAEQHSLADLQAKVNELIELANNKKLTADQMSGSTFTVTNLGGFGIHFFTPIINPPEVAILGLGEIEKYLVLKNGDVKERLRIPLSLTFDHQVIDGAPAARFLQTLSELLEYP